MTGNGVGGGEPAAAVASGQVGSCVIGSPASMAGFAARPDPGCLETPPVGGGRVVVARGLGQEQEVLERDGIRRVPAQHLLVGGDRQLREPGQEVSLGEIVVRRDVIGADRYGILEQEGGRDHLSPPQQHRPQVVERVGVGWIDRHRPLIRHDRLVVLTLPLEQAAKQEVRCGIERVVLERELHLEGGFVRVAPLEIRQSGLVVRIWRL